MNNSFIFLPFLIFIIFLFIVSCQKKKSLPPPVKIEDKSKTLPYPMQPKPPKKYYHPYITVLENQDDEIIYITPCK